MKDVKLYLAEMESSIAPLQRSSKRHAQLVATVTTFIEEGKATTIKALKDELGFSTIQQIHSIVSRDEKRNGPLKRAKVNGRTLIVVNDTAVVEDEEVDEEPEEEVEDEA